MAFTDEMHLRLTQLATRDADDEPNVGSIIYVPAAGGGWEELVIAVPAAGLQNVLGINNAETAPSYKAHYDNTNPSTSAVGDAAAPGTQVISARRDHVHGREAFGSDPAQIDIGDAQGGGAATTPARSDHQHALPAPAAGYPQDVAAVEVDGIGTTVARADHVHAHGSGYLPDAHHARSHDHSNSLDDDTIRPTTINIPYSGGEIVLNKVEIDGSGNYERLRLYWNVNDAVIICESAGTGLPRNLYFEAHRDFILKAGANQSVYLDSGGSWTFRDRDAGDATRAYLDSDGGLRIDWVLELTGGNGVLLEHPVVKNQATPPTAVKGKLYYDTDDDHLYLCTAV